MYILSNKKVLALENVFINAIIHNQIWKPDLPAELPMQSKSRIGKYLLRHA